VRIELGDTTLQPPIKSSPKEKDEKHYNRGGTDDKKKEEK